MTRRWASLGRCWPAVSPAFAAGFFLRMNAAYGPFNLSARPGDWTVLWELWRHGQIASRVVAGEPWWLAAAAAAVPWVTFGLC